MRREAGEEMVGKVEFAGGEGWGGCREVGGGWGLEIRNRSSSSSGPPLKRIPTLLQIHCSRRRTRNIELRSRGSHDAIPAYFATYDKRPNSARNANL